MKRLEVFRNKLNSSKETLSKLEEKNAFQCENCKARLELDRQAAIKKLNDIFDKLVSDVDRQKMKVDEHISETMAIIDDDLLMAESIAETSSEGSSCKSLSEKLETVRSMTTSHLNTLSKLEACEYYEYIKTNPGAIEESCGHFVRRHFDETVEWQSPRSVSNGRILTHPLRHHIRHSVELFCCEVEM